MVRETRPSLAGPLTRAAMLALLAGPASAQNDDAPLSAIPWLSDTLRQPVEAAPVEPPATPRSQDDAITVTPLDAPTTAATGLITPERAGLPATLWAAADPARAAALIAALPPAALPAVQDAARTLLLVEAAPPGAGDAFLTVRIDALLRRGDLAPAQALIEVAGPDTPALFRRWFDILLLTGTEDRACATLEAKPEIAPNHATEVFCLARQGRWYTAALTLETASALGAIDPAMRDRLARFLDPEVFEGDPPLPTPGIITPLDYKLLEAVGEAPPTAGLPLAFAQIDLRHVVSWRDQIAAAERLAAAGALDINRLLELYTRRLPRGEGGLWERVRLVQALDVALISRQAGEVANLLPRLRAAMAAAGLETVAASLFAPRLMRMNLEGPTAVSAYRLALMSNTDAAFAQRPDADLPPRLAFAAALASGTVADLAAPSERASALRRGLAAEKAPVEGSLGMALADAVEVLAAPDASAEALGDAVAVLKAAGLERIARHAALQHLLADGAA